MSIEDFIITVFCIIDDELEKLLNGKKLRRRGRRTLLTDSEVITMEVVGEFFEQDATNPFGSILEVTGCAFF